jgi:hypothetical protein
MLIQEMVPSRWAAVVGAIMCCRTGRRQSHTVTWELLKRWPDHGAMSWADPAQLVEVLRPAGFADRRSDQLRRMSRLWPASQRADRLMPGVGQYVVESDEIFGEGYLDFEPIDSELRSFVDWARSRRDEGLAWRSSWTV